MLRLLSGRVHRVITGVCLVRAGDSRDLLRAAELARTASETTLVTMNELSEDEIREYVASGEPMDKAGAYAIQGMASRWIPRIEGDYSNVVGLPVALVYRMLRRAGRDLESQACACAGSEAKTSSALLPSGLRSLAVRDLSSRL